jgi:hypothetical protein
MGKKLKSAKKHTFKHTQTGPVQSVGSVGAESVRLETSVDMAHVARDVKKIAILVLGLLAFEVALWALLNNTSAGNAVYGLVKL